MIQDSFDPVYYTAVHSLKNKNTDDVIQMTFKYKETLEIPVGQVTFFRLRNLKCQFQETFVAATFNLYFIF
jgi:hypothetical protein